MAYQDITIKNGQELIVDGVKVNAKNVIIRDKWSINDAKDGDVIVNGNDIVIFHCIEGGSIVCHAVCTIDGQFTAYTDGEKKARVYISDNAHLANKDEDGEMRYYMEMYGYIWSDRAKRLIRISWKPKIGEMYYYTEVCAQLKAEVRHKMYQASQYDEKNIEMGNFFKNEQLAHQAAETLKLYISNAMLLNKKNLPNE